jgi:hypothetical protein
VSALIERLTAAATALSLPTVSYLCCPRWFIMATARTGQRMGVYGSIDTWKNFAAALKTILNNQAPSRCSDCPACGATYV